MNKLFLIKAEIFFIKESKRNNVIVSGYRPLFSFIKDKLTSGNIELIDNIELKKGQKQIVNIYFFSDELLGRVEKDIEFVFFEGDNIIGKGKVIDVFGWV